MPSKLKVQQEENNADVTAFGFQLYREVILIGRNHIRQTSLTQIPAAIYADYL